MKIVEIINGSYGHKAAPGKGINVIPLGGVVELSDDEAQRLINLGVAKMCVSPVSVQRKAVATTVNTNINKGTGENQSEKEDAENGNFDGVNEQVSCLDEAQLSTMTNAQLKQLAEDMGIDTAKLRVKKDFISAITSLEIDVDSDDDAENPPNLSAETPIE